MLNILQSYCRSIRSTHMVNHGGADRGRTDDFLLAKQALSQTELQPQKRFKAF